MLPACSFRTYEYGVLALQAMVQHGFKFAPISARLATSSFACMRMGPEQRWSGSVSGSGSVSVLVNVFPQMADGGNKILNLECCSCSRRAPATLSLLPFAFLVFPLSASSSTRTVS